MTKKSNTFKKIIDSTHRFSFLCLSPLFCSVYAMAGDTKQIRIAVIQEGRQNDQTLVGFSISDQVGAWQFIDADTLKTSLGMNRIKALTDPDKSKTYELMKELMSINFVVFLGSFGELRVWSSGGQIGNSSQVSLPPKQKDLEVNLERTLGFQYVVQGSLEAQSFNALGPGCQQGRQGVVREHNFSQAADAEKSKVLAIVECVSSSKLHSKFKVLLSEKSSLSRKQLVVDLLPD
jgi:hypothetical protein